MRHDIRINFVLLFLVIICFCTCSKESKNEVPKIIFDTDIGGDIDDLGALYALHVYADKGLCDIKAVMSSWPMTHHVEGIDAVNTFFGRPDLPIGAYEDDFFSEEEYTWHIGKEFPSDLTSEKAPKTTELYREILSQSVDTSITIVVTGRLNNIEKLFKSKADKYSDLDGLSLVDKKVKAFYIMGGFYNGDQRVESNFKWSGEGTAKYVVDNCSRPMIFNGGEIGESKFGYGTGSRINELGDNNILKAGYRFFFTNPPKWTGREPVETIEEWSIWDIITVQLAVTGVNDYFNIIGIGYNHIEHSGKNEWLASPDKEHYYVTKKINPKTYADSVIEPLFLTRPKNN